MRIPSNSITHLVKIVAEEVYNSKYASFEIRLQKLEKEPAVLVDHSVLIDSIVSNLQEAGQYWTKAEDALLIDEIRTAVATIARNHGRSNSAIASRIVQKELIEGRV